MSSIPRVLRLLISGAAAITVVGGGLVAASGGAAGCSQPPSAHPCRRRCPPSCPRNVQRISGASRFDTAIATSKDEFAVAGSAAAVVLTRADNYPTRWPAFRWRPRLGGPLLLTSSNALNASVRAEIVRVLPAGAPVYILGGTSAVSAAVATTITGLGFVVHRLAGANRFATAVAVAGALGNPTTVFEATGLNFPDALAGGPAAIKAGAAILLTNGSTPGARRRPRTSPRTRAGRIIALGGPAAAADPAATAISGADRYETAAQVAETFFHTPGRRRASRPAPTSPTRSRPVPTSPPRTHRCSWCRRPERCRGYNGPTGRQRATFATHWSSAAPLGRRRRRAQVGMLANLGATVTTESTSSAYTGQFGMLSTHLQTGVGFGEHHAGVRRQCRYLDVLHARHGLEDDPEHADASRLQRVSDQQLRRTRVGGQYGVRGCLRVGGVHID